MIVLSNLLINKVEWKWKWYKMVEVKGFIIKLLVKMVNINKLVLNVFMLNLSWNSNGSKKGMVLIVIWYKFLF